MTLAVMLTVSFFGSSALKVSAQDVSEEKPYVIIMKDEEACVEVSEIVGQDVQLETFELSENNMIVEELTANEARMLKAQGDVLIEEDIVLSANVALTEAKQKKIDLYWIPALIMFPELIWKDR